MRKLTANETIHRIYAGWLGKLAGVRLGAPVEMWTSEQILEKYADVTGYLVDYHEFAADDDTNGPTFFIRAMEDSGHYRDLTAEDIGRAWLNYPPWGKGMYWWGGYGVSSEHTAYENLRAGVTAPRSGSAALNGKELSDQIGGQIFSDAWGLIAPGDPALAASLAEKASSVSHDGEAIYGGRFVAACIAAAFAEESIDAVIDAGLAQIPADSAYAAVVNAVRTFHREHPDDWQACLAMLRKDFWRDQYGGNCHIIPNAGIMAIGLCYGQGDFDKTLTICNFCGFDTDCNVGNLGAILGAFVGLEGISDAWREPINDFYACSSVVGALNLQDAASFALYLAGIAEKLGTLALPAGYAGLARLNFRLPGSTHGMLFEAAGETQKAYGHWTAEENGSLRFALNSGVSCAYHRTYMRPDEFFDERYFPSFSPKVYPGQTVTATVLGAAGVRACLYVRDANTGEDIQGPCTTLAAGTSAQLSFAIPAMKGACLSRVGVKWEAQTPAEASLLSLDWSGCPAYTLDFAKERIERWSFQHTPVSQLVALKGYWRLEGGQLVGSGADLAEAYTGDPTMDDMVVSCTLTPQSGSIHRLLFRVKGGAEAYAAELSSGRLSLCRNDNGWRTLSSVPFEWQVGTPVRLGASLVGGKIVLFADGERLLTYVDETSPLLRGMVGFGVASGSSCRFSDLTIEPHAKEA